MTVVSGGDRTDEIRGRVEAATDGPWRINGYDIDNEWTVIIHGQDEQPGESWGYDADAEFIAHAREDVPWLLDENERLAAENESLRARVEAAEAGRDDAVREMEARELHHFEVENERDAALAVIEKARHRLTHDSDDPYDDAHVSDALGILTATPSGGLAARDARIRRAALEDAADAVDEASGGSVYVYATAAWLRARAAEEGEKQ